MAPRRRWLSDLLLCERHPAIDEAFIGVLLAFVTCVSMLTRHCRSFDSLLQWESRGWHLGDDDCRIYNLIAIQPLTMPWSEYFEIQPLMKR